MRGIQLRDILGNKWPVDPDVVNVKEVENDRGASAGGGKGQPGQPGVASGPELELFATEDTRTTDKTRMESLGGWRVVSLYSSNFYAVVKYFQGEKVNMNSGTPNF